MQEAIWVYKYSYCDMVRAGRTSTISLIRVAACVHSTLRSVVTVRLGSLVYLLNFDALWFTYTGDRG
jgi:hypothetical protein